MDYKTRGVEYVRAAVEIRIGCEARISLRLLGSGRYVDRIERDEQSTFQQSSFLRVLCGPNHECRIFSTFSCAN